MIKKPHAVAVRLTPEEYSALTHLMLRDQDKNITVTLRKVIEPLIAEGIASLDKARKREEARTKRAMKKLQTLMEAQDGVQ